MKPAPREAQELLTWVLGILQREHSRNTTGEIRVQIHEGTVQRVKVEQTETPPKRES